MNGLIYVADDERNIRQLIKAYLEKEGYEVECFAGGAALLDAVEIKPPRLIVLDIMMPGTDGLTVCANLRRKSDVPIIMISARDTEMDRVLGLKTGGDDYLVKPFGMLELTARIESLLRRVEMGAGERDRVLALGNLALDERAHSVTVDGRELAVTPTEYAFLAYILRDTARAYSRKELLEALWQFNFDADTRATDDLVKRLRRKLESAGCDAAVETIWGYGYRMTVRKDGGA